MIDLPIASLLADEMSDAEALAFGRGLRTPQPARPFVDESIVQAASRWPDRGAVVHRGRRWTYREFIERVDLIAEMLRSRGARPGSVVAIALPPGFDRIVAVVATMRCGACYMPISLDHPNARIRRQLADVSSPVIVADRICAARLDLHDAVDPASPDVNLGATGGDTSAEVRGGDDAAYVIHTSGSTGTPKGCMVGHRALHNRLTWMQEALSVGESDVVLHKTAFGFDVSVWEQLLPLMAGAALVIADPDDARDGQRLAALIARERISLCHFVPTLLDAFLEQDSLEGCSSLRAIVCSGEALPRSTALRCHERLGVALFNYYGPTEAAIDVTAWRFDPAQAFDFVPIGRPIDNVDAHVLRADGTLAPEGCEGELHLGGIAIGRGYIGRQRETARHFVPDPFSELHGSRLYRTGDLVRRHADGVLEFIGRLDGQVKLRGFRIELGEIEAVLRRHRAVRQAAVGLHASGASPQIFACIATETATEWAAVEQELRALSQSALPPYMVPAVWVRVERMPNTVHGKLDRSALQRLVPRPSTSAGVAPHGESERAIASLWEALLDRTELAADANFFAVGGDSILAIRLVARARRQGWRFEVADVFAHPTVRGLAAVARRSVGSTDRRDRELPQPARRFATGIGLADLVTLCFKWPYPPQSTTTLQALTRLDTLVAAAHPRGSAAYRLDSPEFQRHDALARLNVRLASEPQLGCAVAYCQQEAGRLLIVLSPAFADWESAGVIGGVLAGDDPQASIQRYRNWAATARSLPDPEGVDIGTSTSIERTPEAVAGTVGKLHCRRIDLPPQVAIALEASEGLPDLIAQSFLEALSPEDARRVQLIVSDGRRWARNTGWAVSAVFGRIALERVLPAARLPIGSNAILDALHRARIAGSSAADQPADPAPTRYRCRIVVVDPRERETGLATDPDQARMIAEQLVADSSFGIAAVFHDQHLSVAIAGAQDAIEIDLLAMLSALAGRVTAPPSLRVAVDFPETAGTASVPDALLARAEDLFPLAPMQESMLMRARFWPDSDTYLNQNLIELQGALDCKLLARAWDRVVERYEALRTGYVWEGLERPLQVVVPQVDHAVVELDWSLSTALATDGSAGVPPDGADVEARLARFMDADRSRPFDLAVPGLWRFHLVRVADERHFIVWTHHHILIDGWCLSLIWGDVFRAYEALQTRQVARWARPRPFRDYVVWLASRDTGEVDRAYWRETLAGFNAPTRFSHRDPDLEGRFATQRFVMSASQSARLHELARSCEVTVNAAIQAAWSLLLGARTGARDIVHGVAVSGRPPQLDGAEEMVGLFINTIPLRLRHGAGESVRELLVRTQANLARASLHANLPLAEIVGQWRERRRGDDRLFDSLIAFENYPEDNLPKQEVCGVRIIDRLCDEKTEYPFGLIVLPGTAIELHFNYDTAHFAPNEVEGLIAHYCALLSAFADEPGAALATLPTAHVHPPGSTPEAQAEASLSTATSPGILCRILDRARKQPAWPAIVREAESWDYGRVAREIESLALKWHSSGVRRHEVVLLLTDHGDCLATAILAAWRLGAVPAVVNPAHPASLRSHCAAVAGARFAYVELGHETARLHHGGIDIVCLDGPDPGVVALGSEQDKPEMTEDANGRIVLFTSGSTGVPKAVLCNEAGLLRRILATASMYGPDHGPHPVLLANAAAGFDIGLWELFYPLVNGGTVVVASPAEVADMDLLADAIARHRVGVLHLIPSLLDLLLQSSRAERLDSLRCVVSGGETLAPGTVRRFFAARTRAALWQGYGPTEASISVIDRACTPADADGERVPLGRPTEGARIYLLDDWMQPVSTGTVGELFIAGDLLFKGYLGDPRGSAGARLPDPWGSPGSVMYRSGDKALRREDGSFEFRGRTDRQVKLQGKRIDLGMLESLLERHPSVSQAAVMVSERHVLQAHLSLLNDGPSTDTAALRAWSATVLPYGLAASIAIHDSLPVNAHGKVDRKALSAMPSGPASAEVDPLRIAGGRVASPASPVAGTPAEAIVAQAWTEVLGSPPADRTTSFFEAGGHSLSAMRLLLAIRRRLPDSSRIGMSQVFKFPTVAGLAEAMLADCEGSGRDHVLEIAPPRDGRHAALFLVHPVEGVSLCYRGIEHRIRDRQIVAFNNPRLLSRDKFPSLSEMARLYVEWVRSIAGNSPAVLGGWSFGGVVALEMARQISAHGGAVTGVVLVDSYNFSGCSPGTFALDAPTTGADAATLSELRAEIAHNSLLSSLAEAPAFGGEVVLLRAEGNDAIGLGSLCGWSRDRLPRLRILPTEGTHHRLFDRHKDTTAAAISAALLDFEAMR
ncbi:amino acid adenylation domain-containing protein [Accumulibacter sp.]|uniref:amino acid adenylation domain-containing protein n=1 Tax=Accumulibacter sp. TaxID=2053492 RepID=UPI0035B147F5